MNRATWAWTLPPDPNALTRFARDQHVGEVFACGTGPSIQTQIDDLQAAGIQTAVLGGDPGWVSRPGIGLAWCERALAATGVGRLHLDVEPWVLPDWKSDLDRLADSYADRIEEIVAGLRGIHVEVDVVPWLFDKTPAATRVARTANAITILAYRDRAEAIGKFAAPAVAAAHELGTPFRIGVETMPVSSGVPAHVTFADDGAAALRRECSAVETAFAGDPLYRGIAVHHWQTWRDLTQS